MGTEAELLAVLRLVRRAAPAFWVALEGLRPRSRTFVPLFHRVRVGAFLAWGSRNLAECVVEGPPGLPVATLGTLILGVAAGLALGVTTLGVALGATLALGLGLPVTLFLSLIRS